MSDTQLRRFYARDEICVMAIGWYYLFLGGLLASCATILLWLGFRIELFLLSCIGTTVLLVSSMYFIIGYGLRNFDPWSRTPARVASLVAMCLIPVGTVTGLCCFVLLKKHSSTEIFSNKYRGVLLSQEASTKGSYGWLAVITGLSSGVSCALLVYNLRFQLELLLLK